MAAVWKITNQENIRMLREKDDVCSYAQTDDGSGRIIVPLSEINEAYASLFGPDAKPYHHNIGDEGLSFSFEYKAEENCYYVPLMPNTPGSEPVAGEPEKEGENLYPAGWLCAGDQDRRGRKGQNDHAHHRHGGIVSVLHCAEDRRRLDADRRLRHQALNKKTAPSNRTARIFLFKRPFASPAHPAGGAPGRSPGSPVGIEPLAAVPAALPSASR